MPNEQLEWRKNIHRLLLEMLKGIKIGNPLPPIIIDAIDSAYFAGIEANPNKLTAKEIYQNGYNSGAEEMLKKIAKDEGWEESFRHYHDKYLK